MLLVKNNKLSRFLTKKRIKWIHENKHQSVLAAKYVGRIHAVEDYDAKKAWDRIKADLPLLDKEIDETL